MKKEKILFNGQGRAAKECFDLLLSWGYQKENFLVLTYDREENHIFLEYLKQKGIAFLTHSIRQVGFYETCVQEGITHLLSIHSRELIPAKFLILTNGMAMNLHPSLLPKYGGCFATMWAIVHQQKKTGVTFHWMTEKFDEGNIIFQKVVEIEDRETGYSLYNKCIDIAVASFQEAFQLFLEKSPGVRQTGERTYFPRKIPHSGTIQPNWGPEEVDAFIRALYYPAKRGAVFVSDSGEVEVNSLEEYLKHPKRPKN